MTTLASTWTKCNYEFSTYVRTLHILHIQVKRSSSRRNIIFVIVGVVVVVVVILADYSCTHIESTEYRVQRYHHNTQRDNNTVVVAVTNMTHRVTFHVANDESWIVPYRACMYVSMSFCMWYVAKKKKKKKKRRPQRPHSQRHHKHHKHGLLKVRIKVACRKTLLLQS